MNLFDDARFLPATQPKFAADLRHGLLLGRALLRRVAEHWIARRQRAREIRELYGFSEQELADVGLSKSDLMAIEKGVHRRE